MYFLSANTLTHACICFGGWSGAIAPCGLGSKCWIPFPRRIPEEEGRASCINGILVDPLSLLSTNSRSIWKVCNRRPFPRISDIKQESGREIVCWNRLLKLSSSSASSDIERGFQKLEEPSPSYSIIVSLCPPSTIIISIVFRKCKLFFGHCLGILTPLTTVFGPHNLSHSFFHSEKTASQVNETRHISSGPQLACLVFRSNSNKFTARLAVVINCDYLRSYRS